MCHINKVSWWKDKQESAEANKRVLVIAGAVSQYWIKLVHTLQINQKVTHITNTTMYFNYANNHGTY